jgi:hypothetical protein
MFHPLIFSTIAFIIFCRTKDLSTEEPVLLRFKGTVINGLRLLHFPVGPRLNLLRRGDGNPNGVKIDGALPFFVE